MLKLVPAHWMGQSHHKPLVWGTRPTFQSHGYVFWLRNFLTWKSLESRRSIIRMFALFFTLPGASVLAPLPENRCGGRRASDLTHCTWGLLWSQAQIHGAGSRVWMCCGKQEAEGSWMDVLTFPHKIFCVQITVNYFIYLHSWEEIHWEVLLLKKNEKSKSKNLDSTFKSGHDQVRGCPDIVHRIKHSPQCLNALQKSAMSDTIEKISWTPRNWNLHFWKHVKPRTFISYDENYRTSGIYLFT